MLINETERPCQITKENKKKKTQITKKKKSKRNITIGPTTLKDEETQ